METFNEKSDIIQGINISWYESKNIEVNRAALVFVHGVASQGKHWFKLATGFQDSYDIYIINRPGYGKSESIKLVSTKQYCYIIKKIIDSFKITKPVYYIGHSMGGYLGLKLTCRYQSINKLILLSPFTQFIGDEKILKNKHALKSNVSNSLKFSFCKDTDENMINDYLSDIEAMNTETIWNDFFMISSDYVSDRELERIKTKTFILHTNDDKVVSVRKVIPMIKLVENISIHILALGGHNSFITSPQKMGDEIKKWIQRG
jgi:pimeloyl-ACP methyl ester carboxylesterase